MTDDLIKRLRSQEAVDAKPHEIEQLTDEAADLIEQQTARIAALETKCRLYEASLDKADAEADGLRKDAGRYRWLRDQGRDTRMEMVNNTDPDMDRFIDEQIAKEPK